MVDAAVDVREMLCAQALAVVAQAVDRLPSGGLLTVQYDAQDVRDDLGIWAHSHGHGFDVVDAATLQVRRA